MAKEKFVKPIHLACGNDELRPVMQGVMISNGFAVATDAYCIVKQSLKDTSLINQDTIKMLEGKMIHKEVWAQLCDAVSMSIEDDKIVAVTDAGKVIFEFYDPGVLFPNVDSIIETFKADGVDAIGLDAKRVAILSKVFGEKRLRFDFSGAKKAVRVTPIDLQNEYACIMPIEITHI
jgi:hypothetical protein